MDRDGAILADSRPYQPRTEAQAIDFVVVRMGNVTVAGDDVDVMAQLSLCGR